MEDCLNEKRAMLYAKIELVSNAIGKIEKEGKNKFSGYKFISHEQVTTAIRPLLLKHSLSIVMDVVDFQERDFETKGKMTTRTTVKCKFTLTDTETGFQATHQFYGSEQDNTGKSMQQAISQANKYFMFKLFKITDRETDGDTDSTPVIKPQQKPAQKQEGVTVEQAIKQIETCKTYNEIAKFFRSVPEALRTESLTQACTARNEMIKLRRWEVPSKIKKDVKYIVARTGGDTFSCQCKFFQSKGTECSHIKEVKEAKHGEGKVD